MDRGHSRYARDALRVMGDTFHAARVSQRVSQAELAERAGISRALVARVERGDPGCAVGSVFEIDAILRVPLFDLDERAIRRKALHTTHLRTLLPGSVRRRRTVLDDNF